MERVSKLSKQLTPKGAGGDDAVVCIPRPRGRGIIVIPNATMGAAIRGVDLRQLDNELIGYIKAAWYKYDVLVFPGQKISDQNLLDFSKQFGILDPPPNQGAGRKSPPGFPDLYVVSNIKTSDGEPIGALGDGEAQWHTDMSYLPHPPEASMLFALEIPPVGGNTSFCCMKAALKAMPEALVERVRQLDIKHDGTYDSGNNIRKGMSNNDDPATSAGTPHPAVIEHPVSKQPVLYLGRRRNAYIMGLPLAESEALLDELWKYATVCVYEHKWTVGDLVMWDNRSTMHRRDAFPSDSRRLMHRSQIKGFVLPKRAK
jgi:taurine dioxygenase